MENFKLTNQEKFVGSTHIFTNEESNISEKSKKLTEFGRIAERYYEQDVIDKLKIENNLEVEIYFDTFDILTMIQGYWSLKTDYIKGMDREVFENDRFLVRSFAYFNYIKNIKLLNPYAVELYNQLDKDYLLPSRKIEQNEIDEFFIEVGLEKIDQLVNLNLEDYLNKLSSRAKELFKANYVLSEREWKVRLAHLFGNSGLIKQDDTVFNLSEIFKSALFEEIYKVIGGNKRRSYLSINNFRDATALCMLRYKLDQFEKNNAPLPIFYATSETMKRLGEEFKSVFTTTYNGKEIFILKDSEYFLVDMMFSSLDNETPLDDTFYSIKEIKNQIQKIINDQANVLDYTISQVLSDWNKYREHILFQKMWNDDKVGKIKLNENITSLFNYKALLNERNFENVIEQEKEKIKSKLIDNVYELKLIEEIWIQVNTIDQFLKNELKNDFQKPIDIFRDLGLTKFSPGRGYVEDRLTSMWNGLYDYAFNDDDSSNANFNFKMIKISIVDHLYKGISKSSYDDLLVGVGILWVFGKFELIVKILDTLNFNYGNLYQIALFHVASLCKSSIHNADKLFNILNCIKGQTCFKENYKAWLGVSYALFNVWHYSIPTPPFIVGNNDNFNKLIPYQKESIDLMKKAVNWLRENKDKYNDTMSKDDNNYTQLYRNVKFYFALNSLLYYIIRAENDEVFSLDDTDKYFNELTASVPNIESYWQSTFEHTIASYYYRKALLAPNDSDERKAYKAEAKKRLDSADRHRISKSKAHDDYSVLTNLVLIL